MSKGLNLEIPTLDEIFGMDAQNGVTKQIVKLPLNQIGDFPNHPFKVNHDESLNKLSESIKENGVIIPIIVRRIGENKYQVISGHRRKEASKQAGLKEISAIVEDLDDDTATILMVDSNMQREKILPSERAFAYKMKMEALKHQGKRNKKIEALEKRIKKKANKKLFGTIGVSIPTLAGARDELYYELKNIWYGKAV